MDLLNEVFETKITVFKIQMKLLDLFFFCVMACLGTAIRFALFDYVSGDYYYFLSHWMEECHNAGGFGYLKIVPGISDASTINYGCMYQYIIVILHYLRGITSDMHLVKWVSVIFDIVCALTIFRLTYEVTDGDMTKSMLSFSLVMIIPSMVLNSGAWAQCDSIYTAFTLLALLHLLKGKDRKLFIYLAIAYTFKQQAIFIVPFILIMWLKGKVRIRYALWMPAVIFITMIPAMIAGRSPAELLGIYIEQMGTYSTLTMNYPSIYTILSSGLEYEERQLIISAGTMAAVAALGIICYYVLSKRFRITPIYMITLAIFTAETALFILPVMHERYGYVPEILAVLYAVTSYRRLAVCSVLWLTTVITYSRFLFGSTVTVLWPLTVALMFVIVALGYDLNCQMKRAEV